MLYTKNILDPTLNKIEKFNKIDKTIKNTKILLFAKKTINEIANETIAKKMVTFKSKLGLFQKNINLF